MRAKFIRKILIASISIIIAYSSYAQDASRVYIEPMGWSLGTNIGMSDMWGNVGTKSVLDHYTNSKAFDKPCFMGGIFGRYTIHPCLAARFQLNIGALYATDEWNVDRAKVALTQSEDGYQRYIRKQKALDYLAEGLALIEFTPFRFNPESRMAHRRGQIFLGAGIGGFYFQPYSTVGGGNSWIRTYDLHLEGQGWGAGYPENYSLFQPCVPVVVGYKWDLGRRLNLGVEWMYRMTFFGYLDGVCNNYIDSSAFNTHLSPHDAFLAKQMYDKSFIYSFEANKPGTLRGTPTKLDGYSTITVTFYFKVQQRRREWWR